MKHIKQIKKDKPVKKEPKLIVHKKLDDGLDQEFKLSTGKMISIRKFLKPKDVWTTNGRRKSTIISHDGVKKIADAAGVSKAPVYRILTQPDAMNNFQYTIEAKVCMIKNPNDCAAEMGESNRSNLGSRGRGNPANMAEKRAYDRAVFRLLGITGLLSEEELMDEEIDEDKMDVLSGLSHEEKKEIAPIINKLLLASNLEELREFNKEMKEKSKSIKESFLEPLRKLYKKRVGELSKSF